MKESTGEKIPFRIKDLVYVEFINKARGLGYIFCLFVTVVGLCSYLGG